MTREMNETPLVSIVIPCYNEERDILSCMDAVGRIAYPCKEVIVVDSSTDRTPMLLRPLAESGAIRLIHQERRLSAAAARNAGIRAAKGEIVIFLDADNVPPPDLIRRILPHYRSGADFVLCEMVAANLGRIVPEFLHAVHIFENRRNEDLVNTQGWSCHRAVFDQVGLFDERFPGAGGEDEAFGRTLLARGFRRVVDRTILVGHILPADLRAFLRQMRGRGGGEYFYTVLFRRTDPAPVVRRFLRRWAALVGVLLLLPVYPLGSALGAAGTVIVAGRALRSGFRLAGCHGGLRLVLPFAVLNFLRFRAMEYGFVRAHWRAREDLRPGK